MHALIIDDSRAVRRILKDMLRRLGYSVSEAANGIEGLERLQDSARADVVLVDWNMPEMNGLEFVKAVRADARYVGLPLMMVTTETEVEQMVTALAAGANEYVMKPFSKECIAEKLAIMASAVRS